MIYIKRKASLVASNQGGLSMGMYICGHYGYYLRNLNRQTNFLCVGGRA